MNSDERLPHDFPMTDNGRDALAAVAWDDVPPNCRWVLQRYLASTGQEVAPAVATSQLLALQAEELMTVRGVGPARAENVIRTVRAILLPNEGAIAPRPSNTTAESVTPPIITSGNIPMDLIDPRYRWIIARFIASSDIEVPNTVPRSLLTALTREDLLRVPGVGAIRAERAISHLRAIAFAPCAKPPADVPPPTLSRLPDIESLPAEIRNAVAHVRIPLDSVPSPLATSLSQITPSDAPEEITVGSILALNEDHFTSTELFSVHEARCLIAVRDEAFLFPTLIRLVETGCSRLHIAIAALLNTAIESRWSLQEWEHRAGISVHSLLLALPALRVVLPAVVSDRANILYIDLLCAARILEGQTLEQVGTALGVTKERVRQRIARVGLSGRGARAIEQSHREEETRCYRPRVEQFIRLHPGCFIDEILEATGCPIDRAVEFVAALEWLTLDVVDGEDNSDDLLPSQIETRGRGIESIRLAATLSFPLSYKAYEELLREGYISGPSAVRLIQVFGTWRTACDAAGVEGGRSGTVPGHAAIWTHDEVLDSVCDFLACLEYRGQASRYDEWRSNHDRRHESPSFGTVRNVLGHSWAAVRRRALLCLRQRWAGGEI